MKPCEILLEMEYPISILGDDSDKAGSSAKISFENDPLEQLGSETAVRTEFYKLNTIVFAEPLENLGNKENSSKDFPKVSFMKGERELNTLSSKLETHADEVAGKVLVVHKKSGGKYKKYQFNIEDCATTRCPQLSCHRVFPTKSHLISHIRRVHCADRRRYICEQCGRGFPERHLLRRHADTHSEKTVECPVCGVKLRLRTSLATHLRSHSNIRPHKCDICKKTFARASSKATHVKFVHREGQLECEQCDKRFSSRKQWSLHMTTHRENKPD